MLTIGKRPQDFIPGAVVSFLRIGGHALSDPILDSEEIGGTVVEVLRRLDEKSKAHNRVAVDFTTAATERRREVYPLAALQQLTRNAVMHRVYEAINAPIRFSWFDDRIELMSPGGPFGIVTKDTFGDPGVTDYRNPNLTEAMKTLGFVQKFGVGIATARRLLYEAGHPDPAFTATDIHVLVVLWRADR